MAIIHDLINQIDDKVLRDRISAEVNKLAKQKKFGLVFEDHVPECTPLYDIPVRVGSQVAVKGKDIRDIYKIIDIKDGTAQCVNIVTSQGAEFSVDALVSVAQFGEPIYPSLIPMGSVQNAPESDLWHTLIEADNYHALQLLEYLYAGKVDCIYIDPPYNTGARDWKYNNDYVDGSDEYRHSKWLSFMEKRLKLAKRLLNPNGALIVAIDDNEQATLKLLLEEIFRNEYAVDCITLVHNPRGVQGDNFSYTHEYAMFVHQPKRKVIGKREISEDEIDWRNLRDNGGESLRTDARNCFYPIIVKDDEVIGFGDVLYDIEVHPKQCEKIDDCYYIYPIDRNGIERKWRYARQTVEQIKNLLRAKKGKNGYEIELGKNYGTIRTVWQSPKYDANEYGKKIISSILLSDSFSYPKSIYNVYDCISAITKQNPNALIVDFFAGSGTTLHAVNLLNAEDGGHRRCIMVTNNEVSAEEAKNLTAQGYKPGDEEWEKYGIARYVTWPRTVCSIEGHDINGNPLEGNYGIETEDYQLLEDKYDIVDKNTGNKIKTKIYKKTKKQIYPQYETLDKAKGFAANAAFFKLGFLNKNDVALGKQFKQILPILWMKAGTKGKCPEISSENDPEMLILPQNGFAVLSDESKYAEFESEVNSAPDITTVYIITDSEASFNEIARNLKAENKYQLYRDYLENFKINTRR